MCRTYLPLAFKQSLRILQGGPVKEAELHIPPIGVHVCYRSLTSDPTSVSPLHGLAQLRLNAFHELPKCTNDRLILWTLGLEVFIEACICLHSFHRVVTLRRRSHVMQPGPCNDPNIGHPTAEGWRSRCGKAAGGEGVGAAAVTARSRSLQRRVRPCVSVVAAHGRSCQ